MRHSEPLKPISMNNNDSLQIQNEKWGLTINGKTIFDGNWNYCETFKLEFDNDNKLINIGNIKSD